MVKDVENRMILNRSSSQDMPSCLLLRVLPCRRLDLKTRFVCGFVSMTWADKMPIFAMSVWAVFAACLNVLQSFICTHARTCM